MRNLLSSGPKRLLLDFLKSDPLLVFDYDGTLVPIVKNAAQARLRVRTTQLFFELCVRAPCAVVSGRSRKDVLSHLNSLPLVQVLGNHGAEWGTPAKDTRPMLQKVAQWKRELQKSVGKLQGVEIEDKGLSLSIHYRAARRKSLMLQKIEGALAELRGFRVIGGKQVVNLLPREAGGKGQALLQLKRRYRKKSAFFIGDDLNDEEVFDLSPRERVFKVRVGKCRKSSADFYLPSQRSIDVLLKLMVENAGKRGKS